MKTTLQVLEEAWALIQMPDKWTQHRYAVRADGVPVDPREPTACKFCSIGAVYSCYGWGADNIAHRYLRLAAEQLHKTSPQAVNDRAKTVKDLAPMWELAMKLAKEGYDTSGIV